MKKKIALGVLVVLILFLLFNYDKTADFFKAVGRALYPVFIGIIIALVLNAPVKFFERTIFSSPKIQKIGRFLSLTLTIVIVAAVGAAVYLLVAPEVERSVAALKEKLPGFTADGINQFVKDSPVLSRIADNLEKLISGAADKLKEVIPAALDVVSNALRLLFNLFLGLIFGGLIITNKEKLAKQFYNLFKYLWGEVKAKQIMAALSLAGDKFSKFLGGQAVEALIFGAICYAAFAIFKIPYAALAALIMALGNLIPMLGAYIAGVLAFIFIFTASAQKALIFVIIILILQQVEQVTTYPLIVGKYVGLSSFWILFSVIVGGGLLGFWGLLLSVPVVAFIDNFFKVLFDRKFNNGAFPKGLFTKSG